MRQIPSTQHKLIFDAPAPRDPFRGPAQALAQGWRSQSRLPIGTAPNIEVSIVVNPDDTALLAPRTPAFCVYEAHRRSLRVLARPLFPRRMKTRARRDSGADGENPTIAASRDA